MTAVIYGGLFVAALLITLNLIPWVYRWAVRTKFLDMPGPRKIHTEPIPYGGGVAIFGGIVVTVALAYAAAWANQRWNWFPRVPGDLAMHITGAYAVLPKVLVIFGGALVVLALGLVDDRRKLPPAAKLAVQLAVGTAFALLVEPMGLFMPRGPWTDVLRVAVTALWIAGVTNVFNFLDHMDGVCAGTAAIVAAAFLTVALQTGQLFIGALLATLAGACAAFLFVNTHPAKMFLGDAGSQTIGYLLGALTTLFTFYEGHPNRWYAYFVPLVVLAVPLFDAAVVVLIRLRERRPVWVGDRRHLAHRLTAMGASPRAAATLIYLLTLYTALNAALLYYVELQGAAVVLCQTILVLLVMTLLQRAGKKADGPA